MASHPGTTDKPSDKQAEHLQEPQSQMCIGSLEHHLHKVFASVRIPGEDFVYSPSTELFNMLDDACSEETMHQPALPIIITGASGTGKSALLSNWLLRRQRIQARSKVGQYAEEFVFWHAVGCTRQSLNVNSLLRRLMIDLKERFDLLREVPIAQERLSWELPRFLEMSAKRGRLIIVIDGLHRLLTNEDTEAGLAWLPLEFPPNVRVILTVTETAAAPAPTSAAPRDSLASSSLASSLANWQSGNNKQLSGMTGTALPSGANSLAAGPTPPVTAPPTADPSVASLTFEDSIPDALARGRKSSKIVDELLRRQWLPRLMRPLDRCLCRLAVETFLQKSTQSEAAALTTGPFLTSLKEEREAAQLDQAPGLVLFDTQVAAMLTHPLGGTPLFLRLFLRCTHYAISRGFSLWHLWDHWLGATTISDMLVRILKSFEVGHPPSTAEHVQACRSRTIAAGGLPALRLLYPWHPSLKEAPSDATLNIRADAVATHDLAAYAQEHHITAEANPSSKGDGKAPMLDEAVSNAQHSGLSHMVRQNLGDQHLLQAASSAHDKMMLARKRVEESIEATLHHASDSIAAFINNRIDELSVEIDECSQESNADLDNSVFSDTSAVTMEYLAGVMKHMREMQARRAKDEGGSLDAPIAAAESAGVGGADDVALLADLLDPDDAVHDEGEGGSEDGGEEEVGAGRVRVRVGEEEVGAGRVRVRVGEEEVGAGTGTGRAAAVSAGDDKAHAPSSDQGEARPGSSGDSNQVHRKSHKAALATRTTGSSASGLPGGPHGAVSGRQPSGVATAIARTSTAMDKSRGKGKRDHLADYDEEEEVHVEDKREWDPAEGIDTLPRYFRGGAEAAGFSTLLGNALALLYVARHGLKEQELWGLLAALQRQEEATRVAAEGLLAGKQDSVAYIRSLCQLCHAARGPLEDCWRVEDTYHTGTLPRPILLKGLQRIHPSLTKYDVADILSAVNLGNPTLVRDEDDDEPALQPPAANGNGKGTKGIEYMEILRRLARLDKVYPHVLMPLVKP